MYNIHDLLCTNPINWDLIKDLLIDLCNIVIENQHRGGHARQLYSYFCINTPLIGDFESESNKGRISVEASNNCNAQVLLIILQILYDHNNNVIVNWMNNNVVCICGHCGLDNMESVYTSCTDTIDAQWLYNHVTVDVDQYDLHENRERRALNINELRNPSPSAPMTIITGQTIDGPVTFTAQSIRELMMPLIDR